MVLRAEAELPHELIFLPAQLLASKLLNGAAFAAHSKSVTPGLLAQTTSNIPSVRQKLVSQVQAAEQIKYTVDSNVI